MDNWTLALLSLASVVVFTAGNTVATPTTPPSAGPPQNNYTVTDGDVRCVVMTTAIQLIIPYIGETKNLTATVSVPDKFTVNGTCDKNQIQNSLNIYFYNTWNITILFTNSTGSTCVWNTVELTYMLDKTHFPNVSKASENKVVTQKTVLPAQTMATKTNGSYMCTADSQLQLNGSISMKLSNLQYRALGMSNSTWFSNDDVQKCGETFPAPDTDIAVAVSVGIALGAMMVVVVVIYIVASKAIRL